MKNKKPAKRTLQHWVGWEQGGFDNINGSPRVAALPDYSVYHLSAIEFVLSLCTGTLLSFCAFYLIYHSIVAAAMLSFIGSATPRVYRSAQLEKRRARLRIQFKEALYSLTSSLAAGRSVENAFSAAHEDLKLLYPDLSTDLLREFGIISRRLENGEPLEFGLRNFAARSGIDDIQHFADVFTTCKRFGGDLVEVIRKTSQTIGDKLEIDQEISVMVAQKKFEARIMMAVPFVFLGFLNLSAPDYMAPLYTSPIGYVLLSMAMAVLGICFWIITRIMSIKV